MDFRTFTEAINVPPHMPAKWWKETLEKAKELESNFCNKKDLIKKFNDISDEASFESLYKIERAVPETIRQMIYGLSLEDALSKKMDIHDKLMKSKNVSQRTLESSAEQMDLITSQYMDFTDFIKKWTYYVRDSEKDNYVSNFQHAREMIITDKGFIDDHEGKLQVLDEVKNLFDSIVKYYHLLKSMKSYLEANKERNQINQSKYGWTVDKKKLPAHKPTEILYHATPYVKEILKDGFKTQDELGREALGGATSGAICFTADIRIAKAIKIALVDVINIANEKLKIGDIIKLAKSEGMDVKAFTDWISEMKSRTLRNQYKAGKIKRPWGRSDFILGDDYYQANHAMIEMAFKLYKAYLTKTKVRYDPLFFGVSASNFKGLDPNNTGVLACKVKMDTVIEYLHGMEEIRVPKEGILKIIKVL